MPTTIPMTHYRARTAFYAKKSAAHRIGALGRSAWHKLQKVWSSDDFRAVATFSAIGLLVGLLAIACGVQGVWM